MTLPAYRTLHGQLEQLAVMCDRIDRTRHVVWATAPRPCRRHHACYRLRLLTIPTRRKEPTS